MSMHALFGCLHRLLSIVRSMESLTAGLGSSPDHDAIADMVRRRSELLAQMTGATEELRRIDPQWQSTVAADSLLSGLAVQVQRCASTVVEEDRVLARLITSRMGQVQQKIRALSQRSRAAMSYEAHR